MGRGNRSTEAGSGPSARSLLFGRRTSGSGPAEAKSFYSLKTLVDMLDNNQLPKFFNYAGISLAREANIHVGEGLAEGEMVHQYYLKGLDSTDEICEFAYVRDGGDYISFAYEGDSFTSDEDFTSPGGPGEMSLLRRLAQEVDDDLMVEFIILNPRQLNRVIERYPAEKMSLGTIRFGEGGSQQDRLRTTIEESGLELNPDEANLVDEFASLGELIKNKRPFLEDLSRSTTVYFEIPLKELAEAMGWLDS